MKQSLLCKYFISISFLLLVFSGTLPAADPGSEALMTQRIEYIQESLGQGTKHARLWKYSWLTVYGGSALAQTAFYISLNNPENENEEHDRFDNGVGAITSSLGLIDLMLNPFNVEKAASRLREHPEGTEDEKQKKLKYAEALLKECADREKKGRSLTSHLMGFLVNAAAGIAVSSDDDRKKDGLVTFATGMIVTELQIFTMPTKAIKDYEAYKRKFDGKSAITGNRYGKGRSFYVSAFPSGVLITVPF